MPSPELEVSISRLGARQRKARSFEIDLSPITGYLTVPSLFPTAIRQCAGGGAEAAAGAFEAPTASTAKWCHAAQHQLSTQALQARDWCSNLCMPAFQPQ